MNCVNILTDILILINIKYDAFDTIQIGIELGKQNIDNINIIKLIDNNYDYIEDMLIEKGIYYKHITYKTYCGIYIPFLNDIEISREIISLLNPI